MNTKATLVATLLLCCLIGASDAFHRHRFGGRRMRKARLVNELCNDSQDDNSIGRDACYGCFYRTRLAAHGYPRLSAISTCADKYITNPAYDHCKAYLRNATTAVEDRGTPRTVYCTVLECVAQVNKNSLESMEGVSDRPETELVTKEEKVLAEKKRSALAVSRYLAGVRRFCEAGPTHVNHYNRHRSGEMQQWHQRRHFRDFRQEPVMNSPRNVFQFYIDGPEPRQAFRNYHRMNFNKNMMRGYGYEYNRHHARRQQYRV